MTTLDDRLQTLARNLPEDGSRSLPSAGDIARRGARRRRRRRAARAAAALSATAVVSALALSQPWQADGGPDDLVATDSDTGRDAATRPTTSTDDTDDTDDTESLAVPDVTGLRIDQAEALLESLGLRAELATPATGGIVEQQDPAPGRTVASGNAVQLRTGTGGPDRSNLPRIEGTLVDSDETWTVVDDPVHGLCAIVAGVDLGCDDVGPVIAPDADPATPRAAMTGPAVGIPAEGARLLYGYLPLGAVDVHVVHADGRVGTGSAVTGAGMYAVPVPPTGLPPALSFVDASGTEVRRITLTG